MPAPDLEDPVIGSDVELLNDRAQPISHPALETWTPDSGDAAIGERREGARGAALQAVLVDDRILSHQRRSTG